MKQGGKWRGKGSRQERGYDAAWDKRRIAILQRDMHLCLPCLALGRPTPARTVDHITPKAEGGTDDDTNLQSICDDCHKAKTTAEGHRAAGHRPRLQYDDQGHPIWPDL